MNRSGKWIDEIEGWGGALNRGGWGRGHVTAGGREVNGIKWGHTQMISEGLSKYFFI